ncbi:hypothetical protein ACLG6S_06265 [Thermodesulfobacteriota bacterium B35]
MRTIDKNRLVKKLGRISKASPKKTINIILEMFAQ